MRNWGPIAVALFVASTIFPAASPVAAEDQRSNVCLDATRILNTYPVDDHTIIFRMRNGDIWRNTLAARCPTLVSNQLGFTQVSHTDYICANTQHIRVNGTGEVCRLGEFERVR